MKILVVIPARGGSKGIPLKNIYPINGKPLIEYTIEAALEADVEFDIVVSTDSEEIIRVTEKYPDVVSIKRPKNISGDSASTESAVIHALDYLEKTKKNKYEYVITLQPTSPLRKGSTIKKFIEEFARNRDDYDAQLTLTESYADYWIQDEAGNFSRLYKNAPRRRQGRKPIYIENSCIYITSVQSIRETKSVLGHRTNGFIIDHIEGLDINDHTDIHLAEFYINMKKIDEMGKKE